MRGVGVRAAMLAVAMMGFSGAQRLDAKSLLNESRQALDFDPSALARAAAGSAARTRLGAFLGRGGRSRKARRPRGNMVAHCGAKQCRKYAAQRNAEWNINRHFEARMAWNAARELVRIARHAPRVT